jgi:hypothetical protein
MKALLLILVYAGATAPPGGVSVSTSSMELPSLAVCKQAGEAFKSMGTAVVDYR